MLFTHDAAAAAAADDARCFSCRRCYGYEFRQPLRLHSEAGRIE